MADPRLLMIDEMSLGLAPIVVQQLMKSLAAIRTQGVTVLLVEQDVYLALDGADRGYVIEMGAVVHSGEAKALINDPAVRQAYLGL
jgi:branched-chain amino acid transport system ATP-binding protein